MFVISLNSKIAEKYMPLRVKCHIITIVLKPNTANVKICCNEFVIVFGSTRNETSYPQSRPGMYLPQDCHCFSCYYIYGSHTIHLHIMMK